MCLPAQCACPVTFVSRFSSFVLRLNTASSHDPLSNVLLSTTVTLSRTPGVQPRDAGTIKVSASAEPFELTVPN